MQFEPLTATGDLSPQAPRQFTADDRVIYGIDPKTRTVEATTCHKLDIMCGEHPEDVGAWLLTKWDELYVEKAIDVVGTTRELQILRKLNKLAEAMTPAAQVTEPQVVDPLDDWSATD